MKMWFRPVKGIAFCIVAAFFGSQAMAQVQVKNKIKRIKKITMRNIYLSRKSVTNIKNVSIPSFQHAAT